MKIDPNAPAYPFATTMDTMTHGPWASAPGMSIRAAMATQIMAGIVGGSERTPEGYPSVDYEESAYEAVRYADALIAALNGDKP